MNCVSVIRASAVLAAVSFQAAMAQDLRLATEIGVANGPAEYTFDRIRDIKVTRSGSVIVLHYGEHPVHVYGARGEFERWFGRFGSGPGEFSFPTRLHLKNDTVRVLDARMARVSSFTQAGEHISTEALPSPGGLTLADLVLLRSGYELGVTVFRASPGRASHDPHVRMLLIHRPIGSVDTLATYQGDAAIWSNTDQPVNWGVVPTPFGQGGAMAVRGDSVVALIDGISGVVTTSHIDSSGRISRQRVDLGLKAKEISEGDRDRFERELRTTKQLPPRLQWTFPPVASSVTGRAFYDANGRLWIELNDRTDNAGNGSWSIRRPHRPSV